MRIEAIPGREFKARINHISVLARVDFSSGWPPTRNFDLGLVLLDVDPKIRPGMTAVARIATDRVPDVLLVPAEAIFQQDGHPIVYGSTARSSSRPRRGGAPRQGAGDHRVGRRARRQDRAAPAAARRDQEDRVKRRIMLLIVVVAIVGIGAALIVAVPRLPDRGSSVPTARVSKTPLKLTVHATGDLRAGRTMTLVAPPVGGMLRIVKLVPTGMPVKADEVVVEFDPADQQFALEQAKSEVAEAEQEIVKMKADGAVQKAQDEVALLTARFDVRRAELDATGNEFIAPIDAQKNVLSLEEARRRLAQLEEDVKSRAATSQASLAVVEEKRNKATLAMQRAQQVIDSLVLKAPLDGVVSVKENRDAAGGMIFSGMALPEYREGDRSFPARRSPTSSSRAAWRCAPRSTRTIAAT